MASPPFSINSPDPGAAQWGPEVTAIRDNLVNVMMFAAAVGNELPDWLTNYTYVTGDLTETLMTYQTDTSIKMQWKYFYNAGELDYTEWYFDKGLGAGLELVTPKGTLTYAYSSGDVISITPS